MKLLTKENYAIFLKEVNYFEGANINSIIVNLASREIVNNCKEDSIVVEFQLECSDDIYILEMSEIIRYRISDLSGISLFGLSGDPHSFMMVWGEGNVVVSIGVCVSEIKYENLISSDFFIESKFICVKNK